MWPKGAELTSWTQALSVFLSSGEGETSLVVQWLRLCAPNARVLASDPLVRKLRFHMPKLRAHMLQWRLTILSAATKTRCNQINKINSLKAEGFFDKPVQWYVSNVKEGEIGGEIVLWSRGTKGLPQEKTHTKQVRQGKDRQEKKGS